MRPRLYAFDPEYEPPYPTIKRLGPGYIGMTEEFIIPDADREMVLQKLYPFVDPPRLGTRKTDIECNKKFTVRDFKVVRERGHIALVSPYYYEAGGTVIDWW
jgi:hypothetical protein